MLLNGNLSDGGVFHYPQGGRILLKFDARFIHNPFFNSGMPHAQQVQRTFAVMLLSRRTRLVSHDLSNDTRRHLAPFGQRTKGTAKAMQGQRRKPCGGWAMLGSSRRPVADVGLPNTHGEGFHFRSDSLSDFK